MSFSRSELKELIRENIASYGIDPWEYLFLESQNLEESETEWPTGQLEHGKGRLTEEEEELEEVSSMAGGAVAGTPGAWGKPKEDAVVSDKWTKLREAIRFNIIEILSENSKKYLEQENKLREFIRGIILEKKSVTTSNPHHMTGINVLETLMGNIMPVVEADYKTLTTSEEQREAFATQLKHSIENILEKAGLNKIAGTDQDNDGDLDEQINEPLPGKEIKPLKVVTDDNPYIDIYGEQDEQPEEAPVEEPGVVQNIDPTGRGKALETVGKIEKQINSEFAKLSDPRDVEAFAKYLMLNVDLYVKEWEDDISQSLSQIEMEPGPEDVVDTEDGLSPGEMDQGGPENDPFMPDDLEEEWRQAENTVVEFYSTAGTNTARYGPDVSKEDEDDVVHFPFR